MLKSTLVLSVLLALGVEDCQGTDPLLLEYSDYYYDLYYGDYEDYGPDASVSESHSTPLQPRSIRVEPPAAIKERKGKTQKSNNKRGNRAKQTEFQPAEPIQSSSKVPQRQQQQQKFSGRDSESVKEPLNVRLQRLLSHDQSSAQTILDIIEAPRQSQEEIVKFLRHIVDRIREEQNANNPDKDNFRPSQPIPAPQRPTPPPTRQPPPPPPPTRPPPPPPTRPPPPPPTRPPPPPPTRPPPPPPTRPPPPPATRRPLLTTSLSPPPPPTFRPRPDTREPKSAAVSDSGTQIPAHRTVNSQFSQFPNFQNHLQGKPDVEEKPRQSQPVIHNDRPFQAAQVDNRDRSQQEENRKFQHSGQNQNNRHNNQQNNRHNSVQKGNRQNNNRPSSDQQSNRQNTNQQKFNQRNENNQSNNQKKSNNRPGSNQQKFNQRKENSDREESNFVSPSGSDSSNHSPTSSSGLTIEEFLTRYPEVKRLSSRFGDDVPNTESPFKSHKKSHNKQHNKKNKNKGNKNRPNSSPPPQKSFTAFSPDTTPATQRPRITPRQRQTEPPRPPPTLPPTRPPTTEKQRKQKKNNSKNKNIVVEQQQQPQIEEYDYGIESLDYDYYYDQLVPEHERFFQLPKTESASPAPVEENQEGFQVFTHFNKDSKQASKIASRPPPPPPPPKQKPKAHKAKSLSSSGANVNSVGPPANKPGGPQAGPFGYTDKGTYFEDSHFNGFPERIEMVYQGFVWAMEMFYPDQNSVLHGGVHTILKDKVKRETVNLAGDYIVRVSGRASPYNINRLTFYTKNGNKFGPWGDRHSDESVDFDVSAPPGQALSFISGTIDFGVPLRSVSFHWRPIS